MEGSYSPTESLDSVLEFSYSPSNHSGSGFFDDFDIALNQDDSLYQYNMFATTAIDEPSAHLDSTIKPTSTTSCVSDVIAVSPSVTVVKDGFMCNSVLNSESKTFTNCSTVKQRSPFAAFIVTEEENQRRRYPVGDSNSKNAIAARDNRLKKKKYVTELEKTVKKLRANNSDLSEEVIESRKRLNDLENEVSYLKSVIANQSTLSAILSSVTKTPGISLSTSFGRESKRVVKNPITNNHHSTLKQSVKNIPSQSKKTSCRSLRSHSKRLNSKVLLHKGVQNMTAKEIVLCCKEKEAMKRCVDNCEDSETDSDMEDVDAKSSSTAQKDQGGVCLHVTGNKVSLEFCANCNIKSSTGVSLDHSYHLQK